MSTFGEIVEPSTRTEWEDWDDYQLDESLSALCLQLPTDTPAEIDSFVILEGRFLYDCVKSQIKLLEHVNSIPEANLHIYKTKENNKYICIIKDYNIVQSSEIVELLKDYVTKSVDIVAIVMKPLVEYQAAQLVTKDYVLRSLLTSNKGSRYINTSIPSLEQPNIIAGVAAGSLCLREVVNKPAIALACYVDDPEQQEIQELQNLLEKYHIKISVKNAQRNNLLNSNLYI